MTALPLLLLFDASFLLSPPGPPTPSEMARLDAEKNVALASLEEGNLMEAGHRFEAVRGLAPGEPLGWADGAVTAMRRKELPEARRLLSEALKIAPNDSRVLALEGTLRELEGNFVAAVQAFEKASAANPKDLVA